MKYKPPLRKRILWFAVTVLQGAALIAIMLLVGIVPDATMVPIK